MKQIKIIVILLIAVFIAFKVNAQNTYDIKVEVVQNDQTIGGDYKLKFSLAAPTSDADWGFGGGNLRFTYNTAALSAAQSITQGGFYDASYDPMGLGPSYDDVTITGSVDGRTSLNSFYNYSGTEAVANDVVAGTWRELATVTYTIEDPAELPNFAVTPPTGFPATDLYDYEVVAAQNFGTTTLPANAPLPIELTSFNARVNTQSNVDLTWTTATEINNDYFTIERTADGENWTSIAKEPGAGNSNSSIDYATTDTDPLQGVSYYRLKQTDYDGAYSYSEIRQVEISPWNDLSVYPNPTTTNFSVEGLEQKVRATLYSSCGQKVRTLWINPNEEIDVSAMDAGIYYLNVIETQQHLKIIIQ